MYKKINPQNDAFGEFIKWKNKIKKQNEELRKI